MISSAKVFSSSFGIGPISIPLFPEYWTTVVRGLGGSHFCGPLGARCCGSSGTVWWDLRVAGFGFDGGKGELVAEISRCVIEWQLRELRPEVELVASRVAAKATVDVALNVDGKGTFSCLGRRMVWQGAESTPLIAADDEGAVVDSL